MKEYYGDSDIGAVLIGNHDWTFAVPNIGGDGTTKILVFDNEGEEFKTCQKNDKLQFISSVQGEFNIYSYDCAYHNIDEAEILTTLKGRYGVYRGCWTVAFVRWR